MPSFLDADQEQTNQILPHWLIGTAMQLFQNKPIDRHILLPFIQAKRQLGNIFHALNGYLTQLELIKLKLIMAHG